MREQRLDPDGTGSAPDTLLISRVIHDGLAPRPYLETFSYASIGDAPIRAASYLDGFGRELRSVVDTPGGLAGSVRRFDFAARRDTQRLRTRARSVISRFR